MKINKLIIKNYKNLDAEMEHQSGIIGFIGNNGSGKSNMLEAISYLFRSLYNSTYKLDFDYLINYTLFSNKTVEIEKKGSKHTASVDGVPMVDYSSFLPKNVIAIYSGEEGRLFDDCYFPFYDGFIKQLHSKKSEYSELPKMLYLNRFYWHISLLTLAISESEENIAFLKHILKIDKIDKIKIDFNKSNYKNYQENLALDFIGCIDKKSEYTLKEFKETIDLLYSENDIYKYLYLTFTPKGSKVIDDIIIKFNDNLTIKELSEGQKKLLLIKAALEFAGQEDTVFILDEPDAHIHVNSKEQITNSFLPYKHNRQIIITTHSPTVTQCMEDDELYMLSYGKIEPKERQEIMEDITGEFWNKHQQSSFLSSKKPIVLLVEGVEDKAHLYHAYNKLEKDYEDLKFDIFSLGGESKIAPFMRGLYEGGLTDNRVYIAIYDNDTAGNGALGNGWHKDTDNVGYRKLFEDKEKHDNYFGFCYPKPEGITHECTVENLFPLTKYQDAYKKAFEDEDGFTTNSKAVSKIAENITVNAKKNLSVSSKDFDAADFEHFKPVFELVKKIVAKNNGSKIVAPKQTADKKTTNKNADFTQVLTDRRNTEVKAEYYSDKKIIIKAGSKLSKDVVTSYPSKSERNKELKKIADENPTHWVLKHDKEFNSVSGAICYATGGNMNGWDYWIIKENNKPLKTIRP